MFLEAVFFENGSGIRLVGGFSFLDQACDQPRPCLAILVFEELLEYPFGGDLPVMLRQLGIEFGLHRGEILQAIGQLTLSVVALGIGEAKPVAIIGVILEPRLVNPIDNLAEGEGIVGRELGENKDTFVLVYNGVAQESCLSSPGTKADDVAQGGVEYDAGDFCLAGLVVGQIFAAKEAGVDPAQGLAFGSGEGVFR